MNTAHGFEDSDIYDWAFSRLEYLLEREPTEQEVQDYVMQHEEEYFESLENYS